MLVRNAADTDEQPEILESFSDVNLNPDSKNFIARVIGDRRTQFDLTQDPPEIIKELVEHSVCDQKVFYN